METLKSGFFVVVVFRENGYKKFQECVHNGPMSKTLYSVFGICVAYLLRQNSKVCDTQMYSWEIINDITMDMLAKPFG